MTMEHGRRTGWTGGQRPQHASTRGYFQTCPVATRILSPGSLSPSHVYNCPKISPSTPIEIAELSRQTRVFRNAATLRKQRAGTHSNRQKNQFWKSENLGTIWKKASASRKRFPRFLPGLPAVFLEGLPRAVSAKGSLCINTFLPGLPRAISAKGSVCGNTFLPGSVLRVEMAVTRSKQSTATFLSGSRIAFWRTFISTPTTQKLARVKLRKRCVTRGFNTVLTETALHSKTAVTHSKQSTGTFLTGARIASLAHSKSSNIDSKLSEGCAWLRL
jgi:hypothetical protein